MKFQLKAMEKKWILYDIANSAFALLISTIIPIYFNYLAGDAGLSEVNYLAYWGYATSAATVIVAVLGPFLGTVSDSAGQKKKIFLATLLLGAFGCVFLGFMQSWLWFLVLFVLAKSAYSLSLVIYDSMLTDITTEERMDEVSAQGYAWGYIGSCIPFVGSLMLVLFYEKLGITMQMAMGISFILVAIWWVLLTIPLLKSYRQIHSRKPGDSEQSGVKRLGQIASELKRNKKVLFFLAAFFCYIDGVYTIIDMATAYGTALGLDSTGLLLALLLTQIVAFPAALLFGKISRKISASRLILVCIFAYFLIALYGIGLHKQYQFWILAVCVGCFQGAVQSMSRSYYAKIIPSEKSGEYFGIYDICGKGASFMGTILVSAVSQITGSVNFGVGALSVMFLAGFLLFLKADKIEKGEEKRENPGILFQQPGLE